MKNKDKFLKVYSNLPIDIRKEIIVVIDNKPISWNVAYQEIDKETELGKRILKRLVGLGFIKDGS